MPHGKRYHAPRLGLPVRPDYRPRWLTRDQGYEIVNLYHLARTALSGQPDGRYERMMWASREFHKAHPETSQTAAYKDLCGLLES